MPVIKANSNKADIREDGKLTKGAWVIWPAEKKDIFPGTYDFVILLNGKDSVRIRIYYPAAGKNKRVIYNIHGGALIACDLETHDNISRILANKTGAIRANALSFGGDPKNLILLGDSGGGLFVACLEVKWRGKIGARAVVLINPATDLRNYDQGPYGYVTKMYLGDQDANDSLVSPLAAGNFSFFPPTLIITSEKDPLRSQGIDLFNKLSADGVKTKTVDMPGVGHLGGFWAAGHPKADSAIAETVNFLGMGIPVATGPGR